jgi:GT2 family glycosyltransferase
MALHGLNKRGPSVQTSSGRPSIAAAVLSYNRCAQLEECLGALCHQALPLDEVMVVDNASMDSTPEMVQQKFNGKITHVRREENLDSAGGFHEAIRLLHEKGHDWVWVIDNDVKPAEDTLKVLAESPAFADSVVGPVVPLVLDAKVKSHTPPYEHFNALMVACPDCAGWIPIANGTWR